MGVTFDSKGFLFARLSFILIQYNARAILVRSGLVLDWQVDPKRFGF